MNTATDAVVLEHMPRVIESGLRNVLRDPEVGWSVNHVEMERFVAPDTGRELRVVRVRITTNSARHVLGLFDPLPDRSFAGVHCSYLYGYVHAHFLATFGIDVWSDYVLAFDVEQCTTDAAAPALYRYMSAAEAAAHGFLNAKAPLAQLLRRHRVDRVLVVNGIVCGPSAAMLSAVDELVANEAIHHVLDAHAGTCALAKVALERGAQRATCVDSRLDLPAAAETLGEFGPVSALVQADITTYLKTVPFDVFDLVILDPFYETAADSIEEVFSAVGPRWRWLVANLGAAQYTAWVDELQRLLAKRAATVRVAVRYGEAVAIATGPNA